MSGMLQANGDLVSYTHTLTLDDARVVGLKSKTLDLGLYTGIVDVQGTIEKEVSSLFIIEITAVS
ncbi:MAG: hypothetical protein WCI00_03275 [bacterium]